MELAESFDTQLPRVAIRFCVKCKWNLRAAYYAQELLQTFSEILGEVALIPVTGGVFTINVYHRQTVQQDPTTAALLTTSIWDREKDGGFPETKELKNRVRNVIDPSRDMGHVDRALKKSQQASALTNLTPATSSTSAATRESLAEHARHSEGVAAVPSDCEECVAAAKDAEPLTKV